MKRILGLVSFSVLAVISFSSASVAEGNAALGKKVYKKCKVCHTLEAGGRNQLGPNLFGIVGKKSAQKEGYKYSKAMKAAGLTWDEATLDLYLKKPKALVKRTKMTFIGLKKDKDRANVIAYLKTFQ